MTTKTKVEEEIASPEAAFEELEAERRRLAFEVETGDEGAGERLAHLEDEMASLRLAEQHRGLAAQERQRREAEARKAAEEADRQKRERRVRKLAEQQTRLSKEIDSTVEVLVGLVRRHVEVGIECSNLWFGLTGNSGGFDSGRVLREWLIATVARALPSGGTIPVGEPGRFADRWGVRVADIGGGRS